MPEQTCLFVTHQARLKCLFNEVMNPNRLQDLIPYRFMNGCVLRLTVVMDRMVLSLVDNGDIEESKPGYIFYVKPDVNESEINYTTPRQRPNESYRIITFREIIIDTPSSIKKYMNPELKIVYYLIRHGQGTHNVTSGASKRYNQLFGDMDAELTTPGISQAETVGDKLVELLQGTPVNYIFVSDLIRTQQTAATLYKRLSNQNVNIITKKLVVIPCSHELTYSRQGCDGNQWSTPKENMARCVNITDCQRMVYDVPVDWSLYDVFYNGTRRRSHTDNKCRTTNMIVSSIAYMYSDEQPKSVTPPSIVYPIEDLGETTQQALIQNNPGVYLGGYIRKQKRKTKRKRKTRQRT